ncbi:glycosyltransferase family 2 protein [Fontivita pretiosa]|uniref:glycosyltransferase family 2 protein n=1 Tax=Fontivita pretiosa TaxID=2989684 RepID=UPI003D16D1F2
MTTLPQHNLVVSFIISTHNRRQILLQTLARIGRCGLSSDACEILVVDNASRDGTAAAIRTHFPSVRVFALHRNLGSCAKNIALPHARGRYVVFLDDDSYPQPGSIRRMIRHFEADEQLGAAVFTVTLPDGSRECSAYPDVFIGCGTGFRKRALIHVGGLPVDFFMQAEEYDLSLRLLNAGWDIRRFDDLHVVHLKTPTARVSWRTMRLDVRNNYLLASRYFPAAWARLFTRDWMSRYWRIARARGQRFAFVVGWLQGRLRSWRPGHRRPVGSAVFERFARICQIEQGMRRVRDEHGLHRVLFIGLGKNILPYWLGARACGLHVVAIADDRLARGRYRGIPIVSEAVARRLEFDAAIISNSSPVHAADAARRWRRLDDRPVFDLIEPRAPGGEQTAPRMREEVELAA